MARPREEEEQEAAEQETLAKRATAKAIKHAAKAAEISAQLAANRNALLAGLGSRPHRRPFRLTGMINNRRVGPEEWLAMTRRQQKNWRRRGGKFG